MHPTQTEILKSLQQSNLCSFSGLLQDTAETSDNLTYHLKQLQKNGFISSPSKGQYSLAQKGLVYLNNNLELGHGLFPTLSCMLELQGRDGKILAMRKLKQPNLGSIHLPTFGITSAQTLQIQIDEFLERYRIVAEKLAFRGVHRKRVLSEDDNLIFDKFFMIFHGSFTSFKEKIDDREFITVTPEDLSEPLQSVSFDMTTTGSISSSFSFSEDTQRQDSSE